MTYKLSIFSYNSRAVSAISAMVCNKLYSLHTDRIPIILNQENFILYKINQALPDSHMIIKPAEKNGQDSQDAQKMECLYLFHQLLKIC